MTMNENPVYSSIFYANTNLELITVILKHVGFNYKIASTSTTWSTYHYLPPETTKKRMVSLEFLHAEIRSQIPCSTPNSIFILFSWPPRSNYNITAKKYRETQIQDETFTLEKIRETIDKYRFHAHMLMSDKTSQSN